ncbi:nucleoside-diphosphate sugar epimerase/dehydratase [Salisediminibacterium halotolerans]|uniref:nucleoside-diphosphate sugar epimerase/dehydratase n=1 Tax=Salisediminibacterium halotolerans TaxID=517425 RepID=UPI000EAD3556|nr:nucleoside-diphosphate sugar epimerase/dehydratase [Salisediminibacterium halotolerans]RLJ73173.1 FlaA1/EpsC-like NDP-sugar epimerase [Actinophytocola xinjiangensis]RPE86595.1 FlaA1/EpsC-like NDP-sugar epimerase [Salisediminibacterium halotolerans]TWG33970.1 FlaA1/EpsC-like NDP-sugar epimerase [Salisediminibacterium halotolerans]GEL06622.1 UDP-N-acetylglucosamine 4,6-dehydratase [Salisediminibacterium halotolerans]
MTYKKRASSFMLLDSFLIISAFIFSLLIINEPSRIMGAGFWLSCTIILFSYHAVSYLFHMNKKAWQYASIDELTVILRTLTAAIILNAAAQQVLFATVNYRSLIVTWLLMIVFIGGSRFIWRIYQERQLQKSAKGKRTLIIGAGSAGTMIARQLKRNPATGLYPVAFIDDDPAKQHLEVFSLPVAGGTKDIPEIADDFKAEHIIIAMPSLERRRLQDISRICASLDVKTQILPRIEDLVTGKVSVSEFREVSINDLLGREPVDLETQHIDASLRGKTVLVTGAGGSIGSEICRQLMRYEPKALVLLGHGEHSIFSIELELRETYGAASTAFFPEIADVQDKDRLQRLFAEYRPDVIYHAAAHKHVPLMERNPEEAVKNNIIGTKNTAEAADIAGVKTFVMVSTDKAVNPTSVMGASKRLAEVVVQHMNERSETTFAIVRFGNVLGSSGSVIPLFKRQISRGGPVTVTDPEMVRYFMTIPEASSLVIQAGSLAKGGETFVLDMGEPVKIVDLAKNLIKLSGSGAEDIKIEFTGIRPGEKLYEELLDKGEIHEEQIFPKIHLGRPSLKNYDRIEALLANYTLLGKDSLREKLLSLSSEAATIKEGTPEEANVKTAMKSKENSKVVSI